MFTLTRRSAGRQTWLVLLLLIILLVACQSDGMLPTRAVEATVPPATATAEAMAQMPPTWTPEVVLPTETPLPPPATSTAVPTSTPLPLPTNTPVPIPTNTPRPTNTVVPTDTAVPPTAPPATALPTVSSNPVLGGNVLPNGSFEGGDYLQNGIGELQLPNGWFLEWDEGPTGFGSNSWDVYVRPETRVLPSAYLPAHEQPLYIWDGDHTVKIFKGNGVISVRLMTDVTLEPGTYVFEINVFPDVVMGYDNGQKIWADDPLAAEVRFIVTDAGTGWFLPAFGTRNKFTHTFTVTETKTIRIGAGLRGRYALPNNGFFVDAWSLKKVEG